MLRQAKIMSALKHLALTFVAANAQPVIPGLLVEQKILVRRIMRSVAGKAYQITLNAQHDFLAAAPRFRYLHRTVWPYVDRMSVPVGFGVVWLFRFFRMADFAQYQLGTGVPHRKNEAFVTGPAMSHVAGFADHFVRLVCTETASRLDNGFRGMINRYVQRVVALGRAAQIFCVAAYAEGGVYVGLALEGRNERLAGSNPSMRRVAGGTQQRALIAQREIGRNRHAV